MAQKLSKATSKLRLLFSLLKVQNATISLVVY